jgi:GNAT superfamily N-acetyltransferase
MGGMPKVIVRRAGPGDAAEIGAAHVRSWQRAYRGLLPQEYLDRLDPVARAERWRQRLQDMDWSRGGVLVIAAEAEIVGFTRFGPTRDQDDDPAQVGEIASIYLLPQAWGTGLGRRLMSSALRHLAGAGYGQATLWVLDSNAQARRFYVKGGWAEDGAVKQDDSLGFLMTEMRYRRPLR